MIAGAAARFDYSRRWLLAVAKPAQSREDVKILGATGRFLHRDQVINRCNKDAGLILEHHGPRILSQKWKVLSTGRSKENIEPSQARVEIPGARSAKPLALAQVHDLSNADDLRPQSHKGIGHPVEIFVGRFHDDIDIDLRQSEPQARLPRRRRSQRTRSRWRPQQPERRGSLEGRRYRSPFLALRLRASRARSSTYFSRCEGVSVRNHSTSHGS